MAETLISPGVLARENDQSFIQGQPVEAGAAVVGPAAKGPVGIPTLVTSFSEYRAIFGGAITSGSSEYTYLTSISANNYFSQGGNSLLVTRVAKGTFTDASSTDLYNSVETGDLALKALSVTGGVGGVALTYSNIALTASSGTGGIITIVKGLAAGKLDTSADSLLGSISQQSTGAAASTYANVATTTNGAGSGAVLTLVADGTVSSVTVTTQGSGYAVGDELVVTGSTIGSSSDIKFIFVAGDIVVEVESATITTAGSGYIVGETISVGLAELGGGTDVSYTLAAGDIVNQVPFVLSTLSEGVIMNSSGSEVGNGALSLGTQDNIRWEIVSSNVNSGTFSLLVRNGNDTNRNKSILETWTNLSLDPKAPNYLEKVIGNTSYSIVVDGVDSYVQSQGEYINKSKYLKVSAVTSKTPDYFDNAGSAKSAYTSSLPLVGSGSFSGAVGTLFGAGAKFYDQITAADIQGLSPSDYTSSITLLNNKDDYKFNLLTAPGLNSSDHSTPVNLLVTTAEARQDCIAVVDLDGYGTGISTVINNASSFDSSYAATYFPWLQTLDPNTGQAVFVPASTLIPGVYAFTDASSDAWFAPAGLTRGALGNVTKAERKLTTTNRDSLYEANVNPIATFPGNGVVVFGQKTLQKRASALDRVNVRRLLIALKGYISQVSDNLVFEQNTIATRNTFLAQVNPYLESVQQRQGLYAFKVVMDDTNNTPDVIDRNQLVGQIYLQPTRTAEFIMLDFNVLPTGAVFPE
mgnify:FL=1|tara:strand:- start:245 stop:2494 length:2250 start_codon:yes stop_codon:yes gene_type:complete